MANWTKDSMKSKQPMKPTPSGHIMLTRCYINVMCLLETGLSSLFQTCSESKDKIQMLIITSNNRRWDVWGWAAMKRIPLLSGLEPRILWTANGLQNSKQRSPSVLIWVCFNCKDKMQMLMITKWCHEISFEHPTDFQRQIPSLSDLEPRTAWTANDLQTSQQRGLSTLF